MPTSKMHENEVMTDAALVRRLLAAQFPCWADLPIERVASAGTDNALYRLGDDMVVRLPAYRLGGRPGGQGASMAAASGSGVAAGYSRAAGHG